MKDPVITRLRKIRDEHAARFNYDINAIIRDLQEKEKKAPRGKLVSFTPRKVAKK